jgi:D-arabinose 1-dehydrogenase-like Zn-dependent alcohol dehydrogenase
MRSVQVSKANGPFEIVERDIPEPNATQVRIKVQACGVCHSDSFTKEGLFPGIQYPRVPGHEIAGVIDKVGKDVTQWEPKQRVAVGWHGGHCGRCESCRRGDFVTCKYVVAIFGVGGLGHLGIQFAAKMGFNTVAIGRARDKEEELVKNLGARQYIDNRSQNAVEELNKLGGAKVILATVPSGKAMTEILGGLAVNGKLVVIGGTEEPIQVPSFLMILGRRSLIGWPSGTSIDSQDTLSFSVLSGVRSMNEVFPLERAAEAYDHMMSGKAKFRCVLTTGN